MTNAEIIAELIGAPEFVVEGQLADGCCEPVIVDLGELNAALDKAREEERKAIE